jgi:hypothetical protein
MDDWRDLRKVLDVDLRAIRQAVETLDRERLSFKMLCAYGQVLDSVDIDKLDGRNIDSCKARQRHH